MTEMADAIVRKGLLAKRAADETFVGLAEAADHYGVSERTIRRMIAEGRLTAYRVGRQIRIKVSDLDTLAVPIPTAAS